MTSARTFNVLIIFFVGISLIHLSTAYLVRAPGLSPLDHAKKSVDSSSESVTRSTDSLSELSAGDKEVRTVGIAMETAEKSGKTAQREICVGKEDEVVEGARATIRKTPLISACNKNDQRSVFPHSSAIEGHTSSVKAVAPNLLRKVAKPSSSRR